MSRHRIVVAPLRNDGLLYDKRGGLTMRDEEKEDREQEMCPVIRQETLHFEPMGVFITNEANRHLLPQSPNHAGGGDRRGRGRIVSRHKIGEASSWQARRPLTQSPDYATQETEEREEGICI